MLLDVDRLTSTDNETLSTITLHSSLEGTTFVGFGLEDGYRDVKVAGETRIPAGIYKVGVRKFGGFHKRYSEKFSFHKGMLEILDVPNFTDILIHIGNFVKDTKGCLLVGMGAMTGATLTIQSSTTAYTSLYNKVIDAALAGNLMVQITDNDRG